MAKAVRKSARDLKNLCILPKNWTEGLSSWRECYWGYVSIYENTPKKLPQLYLVVQGRVQLEHRSRRVKVSRLHANTSSLDLYWRKQPNRKAHLELWHRNPDILERVLNQIALPNSTVGKSAPMQVIKQPEHGRISTNEEQKWSSFQMKYD